MIVQKNKIVLLLKPLFFNSFLKAILGGYLKAMWKNCAKSSIQVSLTLQIETTNLANNPLKAASKSLFTREPLKNPTLRRGPEAFIEFTSEFSRPPIPPLHVCGFSLDGGSKMKELFSAHNSPIYD